MNAAGELAGGFPGGALETVPAPPSGGHGSVFDDVVGRLRPYVAPPAPEELAWQALAGVAMMLLAAGLLWGLPSSQTLSGGALLKWTGSAGLASTVGPVRALAAPLALCATAVLVAIGAIYWRRIGAQPALILLSAQSWLGVLALGVALVAWLYLLLILVANIVIWAVVIAGMLVLLVFMLALAFRLLAALA